jgi:hypothetical protein
MTQVPAYELAASKSNDVGSSQNAKPASTSNTASTTSTNTTASKPSTVSIPPMPMWGGVLSRDVKSLHDDLKRIPLSRKNLWRITIKRKKGSEVLDTPKGVNAASKDSDADSKKASIEVLTAVVGAPRKVEGVSGNEFLLNLLATELSFSPNTINGEETPIGSASIDGVTGAGRTDMSITTMDDASGSVKRWFDALCGKVAYSNGLFGMPIDYLVEITVSHMDVLGLLADGKVKTWQYLMRPVSSEVSLSRGEDAIETLQLRFAQFDTFYV